MRVALLATVTDFGGIEQVLLTLLQRMDREVELFPVLFTRRDADQLAFFAHLQSLGVPHVTYVNDRKRRYLNFFRNVRHAIATFATERFDLVHCHGYRADLLGCIVSTCFGVPAVATVHGFIPNDRYLRLYRRLDLALLRRFAKVMAVSGQIKEELVGGGVAPDRVEVITNGIAWASARDREGSRREIRAQLGISEDDFVFGFVGRLSEEKGLTCLLRSLQGLSAAGGARCRALLVGDGPQRSALERLATGLGVGANVAFAGFQANPSRWYAAMDAFVLPSLTEGTPMALLEAMAHQLPVIATAVGGVPGMLAHQESGILVPPSEPDRLRDAMRSVAGNPELRLRLGERAARTVRQQFDADGWTRRVRDVYVGAIQRAGAVA
ncbi:MAG TPA: glycosyltransferase family 4 protein [Vicinamibacterales bacterium]|nr:glycosyltransferase family 4 protein [Vicinamibacterales bacterium]